MTPEADGVKILMGRHAMVSFATPWQMDTVADVCQSFALDNGAFSAWKKGDPIVRWDGYYDFVREWNRHPGFDFALIPDVIDGTEEDNNRLIERWPFDVYGGCPIWHLHESLDKFGWLCAEFPRVALGSSGKYAQIGTSRWWGRMAEAMEVACPCGRPETKLHGLRMLDPEVFTRFPFASADSTNVARNIGIDGAWRGTYLPPSKAVRGIVLAERIESQQSAPRWEKPAMQLGFQLEAIACD